MSSSEVRALGSPVRGMATTLTRGQSESMVRSNLRREAGQTMVEVGVLLGVVVLGAVVALGALAGGITSAMTYLVSAL